MTSSVPGAGDRQRPTPYAVIFGAPTFDEDRFDAIRRQEDEGVRAATPAELSMLPAAGELLRELLPPQATAPHGDVVAQVSALLFHAYRFWRGGRRVWRFDEDATRAVLARVESPEAEVRAPAAAGYVQLAYQVIWSRVSADTPPEPVDGFFWSAPAAEQEPGPARLDLLYALGVRRGRPGISLFDVALESATDLGAWARTAARPDGADFANVLPGGELQRYHAITTRAEAIRLAALCFGSVREHGAGEADAQAVDESGQRVTMIHG